MITVTGFSSNRQIPLYKNNNDLSLLQYGLEAGEIGVITPLRQQQNLIREKLLQDQRGSFSDRIEDQARAETVCDGGSCSAVEVNTVDKYQGRDKECIVVSCTRSNPKGNVSGHPTCISA